MDRVLRRWGKLRARLLGRVEPVILMYHRVADLGCDPWKLAITPERFAEQLEALTRLRTIVPLDWLVEKLESGHVPEQGGGDHVRRRLRRRAAQREAGAGAVWRLGHRLPHHGSEANTAGFLQTSATGERYIDFANNNCAGWAGRNTPGSGASGPVGCVLLTRAEARFGNGDGLYTEGEYTSAFTAWYNLQNAPSRFYAAGRRIRLGMEIAF